MMRTFYAANNIVVSRFFVVEVRVRNADEITAAADEDL